MSAMDKGVTTPRNRRATQAPKDIKRFQGANKDNIDNSINQFKAYEFLCRQREAKEWIEEMTEEKFGEHDFLDNLKNGVLLCKCCKVFSPSSIDKILNPEGVLKYQETENITKFLKGCLQVGLPKIYLFEVQDLWEKLNVVNVVHCIHSLARFLPTQGILVSEMKNLAGQVEFTQQELQDAEKELQEIEERKAAKKSFNALDQAFNKTAEKVKIFKNGDKKKGYDYTVPEETPAWNDFLRAVGWKVGGANISRIFDSKGNELQTVEEVLALEDKTLFASEGANFIDPNSREVAVYINGEQQPATTKKLLPNQTWSEIQAELAQALGLEVPEEASSLRIFDKDGYDIESLEDIPDEKNTAIYVTTRGEDWINPRWRGIRAKFNNGNKNQEETPLFLPNKSMEDICKFLTVELAEVYANKCKQNNNDNFEVSRLFNYKGEEILSKEEIPDKGLVYVSSGEDWINPESKLLLLFPNGTAKGGVQIRVSPPKDKETRTVVVSHTQPQTQVESAVENVKAQNDDQQEGSNSGSDETTATTDEASDRELAVEPRHTEEQVDVVFDKEQQWQQVLEHIGTNMGISHVKRVFSDYGEEIFSFESLNENQTYYATQGEDWVDPNSRAVVLYQNGSAENGVATRVPVGVFEETLAKITKILKSDQPVTRLFDEKGQEISGSNFKEKIETDVHIFASTGEDWVNPRWKTVKLCRNGNKDAFIDNVVLPQREVSELKKIIQQKLDLEDTPKLFDEYGREITDHIQIIDDTIIIGAHQNEDFVDPFAPTVTLFKNGYSKDGVTCTLSHKDWKEVLNTAAQQLGLGNVSKIFNESGVEIEDRDEIVDGWVLYCEPSKDEDWIDPTLEQTVTLYPNGSVSGGVCTKVPLTHFFETLNVVSHELGCDKSQPITRLFDEKGEEITSENFRSLSYEETVYASTGEDWIDPKWRTIKLYVNGNKDTMIEVVLPKRSLQELKEIIKEKLRENGHVEDIETPRLFDEYGNEITDESQICENTMIFIAKPTEEFTDPFAPTVTVFKNGEIDNGETVTLNRKAWDNVLEVVKDALQLNSAAKIYDERGNQIEKRDDVVPGSNLYVCEDNAEEWVDPETVVRERIFSSTSVYELTDGELDTLSAYDLMRALKAEAESDDEDSLLYEIQKLKTTIVETIRQNNTTEKDIRKMDKKIQLLIKNRVTLDEVMQSSKGMFKFMKKTPQRSTSHVSSDYKKKMEYYSNLFYMLQTEPHYLAKCVYLVPVQKVDQFLETVILSLYGYAFSPREEFLLLSLFKSAIENEVSSTTTVKGFLEGNPVVAKMVLTYGRRNQGKQYLLDVLFPLIRPLLDDDSLNMELNPLKIFKEIQNTDEVKASVNNPQDINEQSAAEVPAVRKILQARVQKVETVVQGILEGISKNVEKLPYGLRWVCKQMKSILMQKFPDASSESVGSVLGYLLYYRYMNPALVSPDAFGMDSNVIGQNQRRNLVVISKVLQNLMNHSLFSSTVETSMVVMNDFIQSHMPSILRLFEDVTNVGDPEDHLKVTKYLELTQRTPPQISISLNEIYSTHKILLDYIDDVAKSQNDPLRAVLLFLGPAPDPVSEYEDEDINLVLVNKFERNIGDESVISTEQTMNMTMDLVRRLLRDLPIEYFGQSLMETFQTARQYIQEKRKVPDGSSTARDRVSQMENNLNEISKNLPILEKEKFIKQNDQYRSLLIAIAKEARNRAAVRAQQRKELERCRQSRDELAKYQNFLKGQSAEYNGYLENAKKEQLNIKNKKKGAQQGFTKIKPVSFSYTQLKKKGVISSIDIPGASLSARALTFLISSNSPGVFEIEAKIAGSVVKSVTVALDDLLERQYNGDTEISIENVLKLNISNTIQTLNAIFVK